MDENNNIQNKEQNNIVLETNQISVNPYNNDMSVRVIPEKIVFIRDNYDFFGLMAAVFSLVYTFCLYKNNSGITAPVFTTALIIIMNCCLKKSQYTIKKDIYFYYIAIELLGIHLCTTRDSYIIFFDYVGLLLLIISCLLHQMYDDSKWGLGRYIAGIVQATFGALEYIPCPFSDMYNYLKKRKLDKDGKLSNGTGKYIFIGLLIGLPILIVVLVLLSSADVIFGNLIGDMFGTINKLEFIGDLIFVPMMFIFGFIASYIVYYEVSSGAINKNQRKKPEHNPIIAITVNAMLAVVYLLFSGIQILYLFIGNMTLPDGYTYADYARQGFFQLMFVCIINLVLVLICLYYFRSNVGLKILLTIITACTYIMIASSMLRMLMYIEMYQLSYLRLLTLWMLVVLFLLMTGTVIFIYNGNFPLFRYSTIVVSVLYISLAFAYPDRVIAHYNLSDRFISTKEGRELIDYDYLNELSEDASSVIARAVRAVNDDEFEDNFERYAEECDNTYYEHNMTFRTFNFSRWGYEKEWR